jgi:hypothetical protein
METRMSAPSKFEGWIVGTVDGEPVNCLFSVELSEDTGSVEVSVRNECDPNHQSAVSRAPRVYEMGMYFLTELHAARQSVALHCADDPAPQTDGECRITFLHDYLPGDRSGLSGQSDLPEAGQARAGSR